MKIFNAILAIITAIAYNLFLKKGFKFYFLDYEIMSDLWYCLMYFHLSIFSWYYFGKSVLENIVFVTFLSRLLYNIGILFHIVEYNSEQSSYFVVFCIIVSMIYEKNKPWLYSLLKL